LDDKVNCDCNVWLLQKITTVSDIVPVTICVQNVTAK